MATLQGSNGRGVHPRLRTTTIRAYSMDGATSDGIDLMGDADLLQYSGEAVPTVVASDVGGSAKRFTAASSQLLAANAAAILPTMLGVEWTMHARVRWRSNDPAQYLVWLGGDASDETSAHNAVFSIRNESGQYVILTENLAGVNATHTFTNYQIPLDVWHLLTIRCRAGVQYEMFINGRLVETSASLTAPTGGGSASLCVGGQRDGLASANHADVDVAGLHIYSEQLALDDIKEDARRANLLPLHSYVTQKVEVEDPGAAMVNLCDLEDVDWLDQFSITQNVDDPVSTCNVKLRREVGNLSLAYLKTDTKINLTDKADPSSYDPLLDINREIECYAARLPLFVSPTAADWQSVFSGHIDVVDWGNERVRLDCRDKGGKLVDTYIEEENDLGTAATQTLEGTIQGILTNNDNLTLPGTYDPITLWTPEASGWVQKIRNAQGRQLKQRREPVMTACRTHAGQRGWDTKYQWDTTTQSWRFKLGQPDRDRLDTDIILDLQDILQISTLKVDARRMRSNVRIVYPSSEETIPAAPSMPAGFSIVGSGWNGVDGEGNRTFAYIHIENTASRNRYGRRFFEIAEAATSMIDTIAEAADMAVAIAKDIGEPDALYDIQTPNLFEIQENGMLNILANETLHTGQQHLAVRSLTHTFGSKPGSSFRMRGKPSVGFKRWMQLGTGPGQARPPTLNPFNTLDDMTVGQLVPFVTGLIDKTNYFGNSVKFTGLRNSSFNSSTRGSQQPPDSWGMYGASAWGTNYRYEQTEGASGGQSVAVLTTLAGGAGLRSDLVLLPKGDQSILALEWVDARGNIGGPSAVDLGFFWYDEDENLIGTSATYNRTHSTTALNEWVQNREEGIVPPAGAKYMQVIFVGNAVNFQAPHYVDSVNVMEMSEETAVTMSAAQTGIAAATWLTLNFDSSTKNYSGAFNNGTYLWTCPREGTYDFTAGVRAFASGVGTLIDHANVKLELDPGTSIFADLIVGAGSTYDNGTVNNPQVNAQLTLNGRYMNKGERIRVRGIAQTSGGAPATFGFAAGQANSYFTAKLRQTE